jgi:RNA polymerase sigma-70 factor (ECF subfamily)
MADMPTSDTPPNSHASDPEKRVELFVQLIGVHQYQIHRYLLALVPNPHDAEDLYQQTNLFLWREFPRFEEGTSFVSWACSVAYHEVLAWRKRVSRDRLVFSDDFLEAVSTELITGAGRIEERAQVLVRCVEKLPLHHRELLQLRYSEHGQIETIAEKLNRSTDSVYRTLSRIRRVLFDCVNRERELDAR